MNNPLESKALRFIPFRKRDLVEMCLAEATLTGREAEFRSLASMLASVYHFEFHQVLESLKDTYAALDPDADTRPAPIAVDPGTDNFVDLLGGLLEKANYERVTEADLNAALEESSLFQIRLQVDFDDFSEVLLFCRGQSTRRQTVSRWLGLSKKTIEFINFERVVVYIRYRDQDAADPENPAKAGATFLKLFQNVPKADLEMLFPNTRVRMRTIDKLLIGIPALVSGGIVLSTKLGATLILLGSLIGFWLGLSSQPVELNKAAVTALVAGLAALGGYLWKQFNTFKNRKMRFMQALTRNLYFKNLDNNAGVFHRLANDAEEEECKEALLAYYFLHTAAGPLSRAELDKEVEQWLANRWDCKVDFEIDDALEKLLTLELVQEQAGRFTAIAMDAAIRKLDQRWDDYFVPAA